MLDLNVHFDAISLAIGDARKGLTKPVFLFISKLTPMVNVDLLIKNKVGQTLLTWRHDEFYGPGWHIPGGVIRFKESTEMRIAKVAETELGINVISEKTPICIHEVMAPHRDIRGHFISMLYSCTPTTQPNPALEFHDQHLLKNKKWKWHENCPADIIYQHEIYREYING